MIKFGTDGWRAIIAKDFTFANVQIVAQAIADYLKKHKGKKAVVGYDRRFLSEQFAQTVAEVLAANNFSVTLSKTDVPTPVVSFHCRYYNYDLGVMITASHNPGEFNGIKIKTSDGGAADETITNQVEALLYKNKPKHLNIQQALLKGKLELKDLRPGYISFLQKYIDVKKIASLKMRVLIDVMHGVGDHFAEKVIGKGKIKFDYLHSSFNPSFGGVHPEPIEKNVPELIKLVKKEKYDLGLVLDGDADRLALVSNKGEFINAQVILPLLAEHVIKARKESGGIGKTVVGSNLIDEVALGLNVPCYETPVGFKYISNLFKEDLIALGGEEAGGIGFKGYIPERDGNVSFLMLLEMIANKQTSFIELLSQLWKKYGRWYYLRTSISLTKMKKNLNQLKIPSTLLKKEIIRVNKADGIKLITKDSWLMFRKSGTEPIVRIYAEARSKKDVQSLLSLGEELVRKL